MVTARSDNYAAASGGGVYAGIASPTPPPFPVTTDGVWTWFNGPRALYRGDALYVGSVTTAGNIKATKYNLATQAASDFDLSGGVFQVDDHDNPAFAFLPDFKLAAVWCAHNDAAGLRVRTSSSAEDISAWTDRQDLAATATAAYAIIHYLSTPALYVIEYRKDTAGRYIITTPDFSAGSYSTPLEIVDTGMRPYTQSASNGVDRIDWVFNLSNPSDGAGISLFHAYGVFNGSGVPTFYKSDGTLIGAGPLSNSNATLVSDGSSGKTFPHDIAMVSGNPWVLFTRRTSDTPVMDYIFSRWNGSAWVETELAADVDTLYQSDPTVEKDYAPGMCFDSGDATKIAMSLWVSGAAELQELHTANSGAAWTKYRDITTGTTAGQVNMRPFSPVGHDTRCQFLWCKGTYTTFIDYATDIYGIGAAA